ncbi:MAG: glycoside hydrolase family 3 protein, partial [Bacteroidetes bacterium]
RRILRDKYRLGLFDNPYVDEAAALKIAGNEKFMEKGREAQAKSMVLLKNEGLLPLTKGVKVYTEGFSNLEALEKFAELVKDPADADVIVKRMTTPYGDPKGKSFLERFFRQGRLWYNEEEIAEVALLADQKPLIVISHLERPSVLTEIDDLCGALMADFGTSDEVAVDVLFGVRKAEGKLPFELPSSKEAVEKQMEDLPYDSENPLYPFGYGLSY